MHTLGWPLSAALRFEFGRRALPVDGSWLWLMICVDNEPSSPTHNDNTYHYLAGAGAGDERHLVNREREQTATHDGRWRYPCAREKIGSIVCGLRFCAAVQCDRGLQERSKNQCMMALSTSPPPRAPDRRCRRIGGGNLRGKLRVVANDVSWARQSSRTAPGPGTASAPVT